MVLLGVTATYPISWTLCRHHSWSAYRVSVAVLIQKTKTAQKICPLLSTEQKYPHVMQNQVAAPGLPWCLPDSQKTQPFVMSQRADVVSPLLAPCRHVSAIVSWTRFNCPCRRHKRGQADVGTHQSRRQSCSGKVSLSLELQGCR